MKKRLVGLLAVFSLLTVLAPMGASAQPAATVVKVYAITGWTDTGVTVTPGMTVTISAWGAVDRGVGERTGPDGVPFPCGGVCLSPDLPRYSLIGKIGSGGPFFVGAGPVTVSGEGTLSLAFNDGRYTDNTGHFVASISYECLPGEGLGDDNHAHCGAPGLG